MTAGTRLEIGKLAVHRDVMQGLFHGRVKVSKELLQQMNAQQQTVGAPSWLQVQEAQSGPPVATKDSPSSSRPEILACACAWSQVRIRWWQGWFVSSELNARDPQLGDFADISQSYFSP